MIGTDSGVPLTFHSDSTWREIEIWVEEFGVDPMQAIRAPRPDEAPALRELGVE